MENEYHNEGEGEFYDSDDPEWPDSGYKVDCLPLQETQDAFSRTYNMLEQDRYRSHKPSEENFHILIALVLYLIYCLYRIIAENDKVLKDLDIVQTENQKLNTLVTEMRSRVECQVCFVPPRRGPVPMCPNGHFICTSCKARNRQEGKTHCPTCQQPLHRVKNH